MILWSLDFIPTSSIITWVILFEPIFCRVFIACFYYKVMIFKSSEYYYCRAGYCCRFNISRFCKKINERKYFRNQDQMSIIVSFGFWFLLRLELSWKNCQSSAKFASHKNEPTVWYYVYCDLVQSFTVKLYH
jgi:hypothetical protein